MFKTVYEDGMAAAGGDPLKAALNLIDTFKKWPDTVTWYSLEALDAFIREARVTRK